MKFISKNIHRVLLFVLAVFCGLTITAAGQSSGGSFTITNSVVAGGGCGSDGAGGCIPSTNSPTNSFTVEGTPGEAGASDLSRNPPYSERGGFWYGNLSASPTAADGNISGRITDEEGNPIEGAAIRLSGIQNRLAVTDFNGEYHFDNIETNGFYTVTPSRANYEFNPSQRSFSQLGSHTESAFTATLRGGGMNPLDTSTYFVRQQYVDFLGREPDESGFTFWVNNIESCGDDQSCRNLRRIDTSAAFFLSSEFQQTGFFVYRIYQTAFGDRPNAPVPLLLSEFIPDEQKIGSGVIGNQTAWASVLENNKRVFTEEFVQRARFTIAYPTTMTPSQFVDQLFGNAGVTPSASDRAAAIAEFASANTSSDLAARARALLRVAENETASTQEFNPAFVLMQYFGYLRRDPNAGQDTNFSGYDFWLTKLNRFNGNYQQSEMVKAFLSSVEYRGRFPR